MEFVMTILQGALRYLLTLKLADWLDIALMAYGIYWLLKLVGDTKVERLGKGVIIFLLALWLSHTFHLNGIYFILSHVVELGVLALIVLFQPEIRQLLEKLGSRNIKLLKVFKSEVPAGIWEKAIDQTVVACAEMSRAKTGALIVFEREIKLDEMVRSGTAIDAAVTSELLKNIFFINAPMHDGACIIRNGRILGAGCMLPLSGNVNLSRDLGMRHRAGIGMSENSDAVVVIVSEETGSISVAQGGMLKRHLLPDTLAKLLRNELLVQENESGDESSLLRLKNLFRHDRGEDGNGKD